MPDCARSAPNPRGDDLRARHRLPGRRDAGQRVVRADLDRVVRDADGAAGLGRLVAAVLTAAGAAAGEDQRPRQQTDRRGRRAHHPGCALLVGHGVPFPVGVETAVLVPAEPEPAGVEDEGGLPPSEDGAEVYARRARRAASAPSRGGPSTAHSRAARAAAVLRRRARGEGRGQAYTAPQMYAYLTENGRKRLLAPPAKYGASSQLTVVCLMRVVTLGCQGGKGAGVGAANGHTTKITISIKRFDTIICCTGSGKKISSDEINKKVLESLILVGACDNLKEHRAQLHNSLNTIIDFNNKYIFIYFNFF